MSCWEDHKQKKIRDEMKLKQMEVMGLKRVEVTSQKPRNVLAVIMVIENRMW